MSGNQLTLVDIEILHQQIKDDNVAINEIVKDFSIKYPRMTHVCDRNGNSAAFSALKYGKLHIYEILISHGFSLYQQENIDLLLKILHTSRGICNENEVNKLKKRLRGIHLSYFRYASLRHLNILSAKSQLSLSTSIKQRREYREKIDRAFEDLNEIEEIVPLLKLAANSEKLKIIFDFRKNSVEHMDPTSNDKTLGLTYPKSELIYIGAEGLLDPSTRFDCLGVLAHELCHLAMKLVYNNDCKPYAQNSVQLATFQDISNFCDPKNTVDTNDIISLTYTYPVERHHAELIARVPHLIASLRDSPLELEVVQRNFFRLFDYYSSIITDMKTKLERYEASSNLKTLNAVCGALTCLENPEIYNTSEDLEALKSYLSDVDSKLLNIATNCTQLTMISIYKKLKLTDKLYSFTRLEHFARYEINNIGRLFRLLDKLIIVIDCDGHQQHQIEIIVNQLRVSNMNSRVIFVTNHYTSLVTAENFCVIHPWTQ